MVDKRTREYRVDLAISREELLKYYRGDARQVVARASNGQTISFPVESLKPFVTHGGIVGSFRVIVSHDNRLMDVKPYR